PVTITGPGAGVITVNGANASRIFNTSASTLAGAISISGLTFTAGRASSFGGAILANDEQLVISSSIFSSNSAPTGNGGAIAVTGDGTLTAFDRSLTTTPAAA